MLHANKLKNHIAMHLAEEDFSVPIAPEKFTDFELCETCGNFINPEFHE